MKGLDFVVMHTWDAGRRSRGPAVRTRSVTARICGDPSPDRAAKAPPTKSPEEMTLTELKAYYRNV